ncbi:hypothetical protein VOLCADRAFT_117484, partial [Volvox carteri f. nagariensis]
MPVPLRSPAPATSDGRLGQRKGSNVQQTAHRRLSINATPVAVVAATKEQSAPGQQPSDRSKATKSGFTRPEESLVPPRSSTESIDWFYSETAQREWVQAMELDTLTPEMPLLLKEMGMNYDPDRLAAVLNKRWPQVYTRAVQVSATLGGFTAAVARDYALGQFEANMPQRARELRTLLGKLGPALVKIGQALSARPDLLPRTYLEALSELQDRLPSFPNEIAFAVIEEELGQPVTELFAELSELPVAAASLGQVYRARLRDGTDVAVKVQRPNIGETIAVDMMLLRRLMGVVDQRLPQLGISQPLVPLVDEFARRLFAELDYVQEGHNCERFQALYGTMPRVRTPKIYWQYTSRRVLTMEWIEGVKLTNSPAMAAAGLDVVDFVDVGIECTLRQLLEHGYFHAGNLLATRSGDLVYLDFGMMSEAPQYARDYEAMCKDYYTLQFMDPSVDTSPIAPALAAFFDDVLQSSVSQLNFKAIVDGLGEVLFRFPFRVPAYYALILRSLTVLEGLALQADPNYKLLAKAYPYMAKRLLTDPAPELRESFEDLIIKDGQFRWSRLENLLREGSKSSDFDPTQLWLLAEWLLSPGAAGVRATVVTELGRVIDAAAAADVRQRIEAQTGDRAIAETLVPPQPAEAEAQERAALLLSSISSRLQLQEPLQLQGSGPFGVITPQDIQRTVARLRAVLAATAPRLTRRLAARAIKFVFGAQQALARGSGGGGGGGAAKVRLRRGTAAAKGRGCHSLDAEGSEEDSKKQEARTRGSGAKSAGGKGGADAMAIDDSGSSGDSESDEDEEMEEVGLTVIKRPPSTEGLVRAIFLKLLCITSFRCRLPGARCKKPMRTCARSAGTVAKTSKKKEQEEESSEGSEGNTGLEDDDDDDDEDFTAPSRRETAAGRRGRLRQPSRGKAASSDNDDDEDEDSSSEEEEEEDEAGVARVAARGNRRCDTEDSDVELINDSGDDDDDEAAEEEDGDEASSEEGKEEAEENPVRRGRGRPRKEGGKAARDSPARGKGRKQQPKAAGAAAKKALKGQSAQKGNAKEEVGKMAAAGGGSKKHKGPVERILSYDSAKDKYLVKLKDVSYRHTTYVTQSHLEKFKPNLLRSFQNREEAVEVEAEWLQVDRVIAARTVSTPGRQGKSRQLLIKWRGLEYSDSTWENEEELQSPEDKAAIERFERINGPTAATGKKQPDGTPQALRQPGFELPTFCNERSLRDYQQVSVRWMVNNYCQRRNCILGDEMGLGKTAQSISCLEVLRSVGGIPGPFLIVAPLSTLGHWQREIQTWTDMNVVFLSGTAADRAVILEHEFYRSPGSTAGVRNSRKEIKFNVLLVSYNTLLKERSLLGTVSWAAAVFDEAHRLKGINSSTRAAVEDLDIDWLLLLTGTWLGGTPIQNNMLELYSILSLLDPDGYPTPEDFTSRFGGAPGGSPPTVEQIRALQVLCEGLEEDLKFKLAQQRSQGAPEEFKSPEVELLVRGSGKMVLLHKLLHKLRAEGRRVLIFSQFVIMLNVLEDYCNAVGFPVERIDGSIQGRDRQRAIDRFCAEGEGSDGAFVFLLSTRAGGQGITLTAADTCIIYDSDWNPQNDLQAMARCHRIGQKKEVTVYRLISRDTYEMALFNSASRKYGLDEAILGFSGGSDPESDSARIAELLRHGAHGLLADMEAGLRQGEAFASEDINQILAARTEKRQIGSRAGNTFSVATFAADDGGAAGGETGGGLGGLARRGRAKARRRGGSGGE